MRDKTKEEAHDAFIECLVLLRDEPEGLAIVCNGHYSVTVIKSRKVLNPDLIAERITP